MGTRLDGIVYGWRVTGEGLHVTDLARVVLAVVCILGSFGKIWCGERGQGRCSISRSKPDGCDRVVQGGFY